MRYAVALSSLVTGTAIADFIVGLNIWPLVIMLVPYVLLFRKAGIGSQTKRVAHLMQSITVFLVMTAAALTRALSLTDLYFIGAVIALAVGVVLLRARMFPYRTRCPKCGRRFAFTAADIRSVYVNDDNLCSDCSADSPDDT